MKTIRNQPNSAVTLSVLDRLKDDDPRSRSDENTVAEQDAPQMREKKAPIARERSRRELRAGVRRDLEWLLNTRRNPDDPGVGQVETENSLYSYGLPDFSTYAIASPKDQAKLVRVLQTAVKSFEPRLANVKVVPLEINPKGLRTMKIRIEGLLLMDPAPEHISFDTTLQLTTGDFSVKDEASA
jgi:type VI secretion system protein ImpF